VRADTGIEKLLAGDTVRMVAKDGDAVVREAALLTIAVAAHPLAIEQARAAWRVGAATRGARSGATLGADAVERGTAVAFVSARAPLGVTATRQGDAVRATALRPAVHGLILTAIRGVRADVLGRQAGRNAGCALARFARAAGSVGARNAIASAVAGVLGVRHAVGAGGRRAARYARTLRWIGANAGRWIARAGVVALIERATGDRGVNALSAVTGVDRAAVAVVATDATSAAVRGGGEVGADAIAARLTGRAATGIRRAARSLGAGAGAVTAGVPGRAARAGANLGRSAARPADAGQTAAALAARAAAGSSPAAASGLTAARSPGQRSGDTGSDSAQELAARARGGDHAGEIVEPKTVQGGVLSRVATPADARSSVRFPLSGDFGRVYQNKLPAGWQYPGPHTSPSRAPLDVHPAH
jgi:hypothetical protein